MRHSILALFVVLLCATRTIAQNQSPESNGGQAAAFAAPDAPGFSSSSDAGTADPAQDQPQDQPQYSRAERDRARIARHPIFDDQYHWGLLGTVGTGGLGLQLAYPISFHLLLRGGAEFFRYSTTGQRGDATYDGTLQVGDGRIAIDYFPWKERRFHISPLLVFANQTRAAAHFNLAPNEVFDLEQGSFYTLASDPLRGTGELHFRKTSPGLALGFGNLSHGHGHWLFPVEFGFYYNSTPSFHIDFTGTVCDPDQPPAIGCQSVATNADFQNQVQDLRDEVNRDLHYARFIPILNYGIGYRF